MTSIIDRIRADREELARVLKKHTGIRKIVEDLYPDSAHFIYELLQNAEDAAATKVQFRLSRDALLFEHDGCPFTEDDVKAITDIGEGTKATDEEKIGRFGIGFKAVFAYTEKPEIWSPTFSFTIAELVLPNELPQSEELGEFTRFRFPFNNPKKPVATAFDEVKKGLEELDGQTLIFLSNIQAVIWQVVGESEQAVLRVEHPDSHIEIIKDTGAGSVESVHYLRFTHQVRGLDSQQVAIAFRLSLIERATVFNHDLPLSEQFRIVPTKPARVAVFFAAAKETSGLRFHLHAPFVPELSRASIKDTPSNTPLFQQLAALAARSLFAIRDLGLLTPDFLGVLPNANDEIPERYAGIRESIIEAMNERPLTPTYDKRHLPAKRLLQAKASLKVLLTIDDLKQLMKSRTEEPAWAIGAAQRNSNIDRFLGSLEIERWDMEHFTSYLDQHLSGRRWFDREKGRWVDGIDLYTLIWLGKHSAPWHQQLYALLYQEAESTRKLAKFSDLDIVRLANGDYKRGAHCYFPTAGVQSDKRLPRVAIATYTSGKNHAEQENARRFLEGIGVREVGAYEQVEAILGHRYSDASVRPDHATYNKDLQKFISVAEVDQKAVDLLGYHHIFEREDGSWALPHNVFIDTPYADTGLATYFQALGDATEVRALSTRYLDIGISRKKILSFAESVGVKTRLEIQQVPCSENPQRKYLMSAPGLNFTSYGINRDYIIRGLTEALESPSVPIARLIWSVVQKQTSNGQYLTALYRKNQANEPRSADSQLVHILRNSAWIPQNGDRFVKPNEARVEELPEGFAFDAKAEWIARVGFGQNAKQADQRQAQKREVARELGFQDDKTLADARWFARLNSDERLQLRSEYESRHIEELPASRPKNPERRSERVEGQATLALERSSEKRVRSVSIGRDATKQETAPYLRQQYTNGDGQMICQICRNALPFKVADGTYFFFAVEFLPDLKLYHHQNYLSLCPNHAAMFRWANDSRDELWSLFADLDGTIMTVSLAGSQESVFFTETHLLDLRACIEGEQRRIEGATAGTGASAAADLD